MQTLLRLALLTGMLLARTAAGEPAPHVVGDPRHPGPDLPPRGQSLLDELYARDDGTHALPFPFEALLHDLRSRVAPGEITTVLIPLGRSLQRHAAWPDYFAAPRIVAAVTSDPGRPRGPWLQDRLYLGFHPLAEVIEVLSWNEGAGRFEFQVVESYRPGAEPRVEYADRATCVICHQSQSPIFATPLWSETNANPAVAQRLAALGEHYHGVPVEGSVDRADALDRSTDRAFHLTFAGWLWREACAATGDGPACRGGLLLEALAFRLRGDRDASRPEPKARQLAAELTEALASGAPAGVVAISPDLPNRDPLEAILAGTDPFDAVEAAGVHAPEVPRPTIPLWTPDPPPARTLKMAVRELAAQFADRDVQELDRELRSLADGAGFEPVRVPCRIDRAERNDRRASSGSTARVRAGRA